MGMTPEKRIESYLTDMSKKHDVLCQKFISGTSGVPDRILIKNGKVIFVEVKRPGARPRPLQEVVIQRMRDHGADVRIIDSREGCEALIEELII